MSDLKSDLDSKLSICNQRGKVIKLCHRESYGFINSDKQGEVYFTTGDLFGCAPHDLHANDSVYFDAVRGPLSASVRWKATKVWKSNPESESLACVKTKYHFKSTSDFTPVHKSKVYSKLEPITINSQPEFIGKSKSDGKNSQDVVKRTLSKVCDANITPEETKHVSNTLPRHEEQTCDFLSSTVCSATALNKDREQPKGTKCQSNSTNENKLTVKTCQEQLTYETGIISRILSTFGFITSKTHGLVHYHRSVIDYKPCLGDSVIFDAVPAPQNVKSKWKATKVSLNKLGETTLQSKVSGAFSAFGEESRKIIGNDQTVDMCVDTNCEIKVKNSKDLRENGKQFSLGKDMQDKYEITPEISNTYSCDIKVDSQRTENMLNLNVSKKYSSTLMSLNTDYALSHKEKSETKANSSKCSNKLSSGQKKEAKNSSSCDAIVNQVGVISKICRRVGFIKPEMEGTGDVCFHFSNIHFKFSVGDSVVFDAVVGPPDKSNKWRATKVSKFKACKSDSTKATISNTSQRDNKSLTYESRSNKTCANADLKQKIRKRGKSEIHKIEPVSSKVVNANDLDYNFEISQENISPGNSVSFENDLTCSSVSEEELKVDGISSTFQNSDTLSLSDQSNNNQWQSNDLLKLKGPVVSTNEEYQLPINNEETSKMLSLSLASNCTRKSISSTSDGTDLQAQKLSSVETDIDIKQLTVLYMNQSELILLLHEQHFTLYKIDRKKAVSHQDLNIPKNIYRGDIIILPTSNITRLLQESITVTESVSFPVASTYSTTFAKVEQIVKNTIFLRNCQSYQAFRYTFDQTVCIESCFCGCLSRHVLQGDLFKIVTSSESCHDGSKQVITLTPVQEILHSAIKFNQITIESNHFEHSSHNVTNSITNGRGLVQWLSSSTLVISMQTGEVILCTDKEIATLWSLQIGDVVKFNAVTSGASRATWTATYLALEYVQSHQR